MIVDIGAMISQFFAGKVGDGCRFHAQSDVVEEIVQAVKFLYQVADVVITTAGVDRFHGGRPVAREIGL